MPLSADNSKRYGKYVAVIKILLALAVIFLAIYTFSKYEDVGSIENSFTSTRSDSSDSTITISAPSGSIRTLVSDDPALRERGLSGRESLDADQGMLFIFDEEGSYGFWMKDMNFSLDLVWIDGQKRVVGVTEDVSPETYPKSFYPLEPVRYVLELNSGQAKIFGIKQGTSLQF